MNKNQITILLFIFSFSCQNKKIKNIEKTFVGTQQTIIELADSCISNRQDILFYRGKPFTGIIIDKYPNNYLALKSVFMNGLLEGKQAKWYSDGSKLEVRDYHENRKVGTHQGWWENGQMKFEYFIENDVPIGTHREWYMKGQLYSLFNFDKNGQPEGVQKMWFENGQIKSNYIIKDGRRFGFLGAKGCMGEGEKKIMGIKFKK